VSKIAQVYCVDESLTHPHFVDRKGVGACVMLHLKNWPDINIGLRSQIASRSDQHRAPASYSATSARVRHHIRLRNGFVR